jgi:hypothetical protein
MTNGSEIGRILILQGEGVLEDSRMTHGGSFVDDEVLYLRPLYIYSSIRALERAKRAKKRKKERKKERKKRDS